MHLDNKFAVQIQLPEKIKNTNIGPVKQMFLSIKLSFLLLFISLYICFGCSKEPSHRDGSFEYPQNMF